MMDSFRSFIRSFVLSLGIVMLLLSYVCAKPETDNPLKNVNLSPFWQWWSAYECMQNTSIACGNKDITLAGVVDVNSTELENYCNGGCAEHTRRVLWCISLVNRHFWFANGLSVHKLNDTINDGCNHNKTISTVGIKSSATKRSLNLAMSFVSSLAVLITISIFAI